jgi:hypothetical protein
MKEQDMTKIEFTLSLNDNIVVQRFFNVKGFNPKSKNSVELYDYVRDLKDELEYNLKMRTVVYMLDNMYQIMEDPKVMDTSFTDGPEVFNLIIKVEDKTICHRAFDAKKYPPKIRYTVDIRPQIKSILRDLTDIFSTKNLTYEYLEFNLNA